MKKLKLSVETGQVQLHTFDKRYVFLLVSKVLALKCKPC